MSIPLDMAANGISEYLRSRLLRAGIDLKSWVEAVLRAMEPFARDGVLLERIWPPGETPQGWPSQLGGCPNLPPDWEWPRGSFADVHDSLKGRGALDFLAQIHLPDLPDVPERALLPTTGMLYFFALSQAPLPLEGYGSKSWRVLYYPGDAAKFPPRMPPADAGWISWGEAGGPAALLHDPDEPSGDLHPRCPIQLMRHTTWRRPTIDILSRPQLAAFEALAQLSRSSVQDAINEASDFLTHLWQGSAPPLPSEPTRPAGMPPYVEGARLLLLYARNRIFNQVSISVDKSKFPPGAFEKYKAALDDWFQRIESAARMLKARGRTALIDDEDRARIRSFYDETAMLRELGGRAYRLRNLMLESASMRLATYTSWATLALDDPEFVKARSPSILAAHPAYLRMCHQMLGYGSPVQSDLAEGAVLLLQLKSDWYAPRFQWWDMGNVTFWISHRDLAARRFENAKAEIEGH
jgi:hypothetical protein